MADNKDEIIRRYKLIAHAPEFMFFWTFRFREEAVARLNLKAGDRAVEIGCGTGVNFPYLVRAVGETGEVVGVDISPEMIAKTRERIAHEGWKNAQVIESAAEEVVLPDQFDGMLMFATHDVLTSPKALDNILTSLKPGARIVIVGPKLAGSPNGRWLNLLVNAAYSHFAVATHDKDRPWRLIGQRVPVKVIERAGGILFVAEAVMPDA